MIARQSCITLADGSSAPDGSSCSLSPLCASADLTFRPRSSHPAGIVKRSVSADVRGDSVTLLGILRAMLRRWYVVLVVVLSAVYLTTTFVRDSGCYITDTVVTFTLPAMSPLQPDNGSTDSNVIAFASAIADEVSSGGAQALYATADAPSYGAGVRQGIWVGVPNTGGQWSTSFSTAAIEIQIVGRTAAWVRQQQHAALARIDAASRFRQSAARTRHVSMTIEPLSTEVSHILPTRSDRLMAFAAIGVGTFIAVVMASLTTEALMVRAGRQRLRRPSHRAEPHPIGATS